MHPNEIAQWVHRNGEENITRMSFLAEKTEKRAIFISVSSYNNNVDRIIHIHTRLVKCGREHY